MAHQKKQAQSPRDFRFEECQVNSLKILTSIVLIVSSIFIAIPAAAQNAEAAAGKQFHDDLFDHFVGNWAVSSVAHGSSFTGDLEAAWVMNHQHLRIHFKSHQIIPWWNVQMEFEQFIGYNPLTKKYVVHGVSIEGYGSDPAEGFCYGYRNGNEFKTVSSFGVDSLVVQRFTWQPVSNSWNIKTTLLIAGKEGEAFLDLKLVAVKPSSNKKKTMK